MKGEIDKDFYCSADLFGGDNKLKIYNTTEHNEAIGDCIGVCKKCHCRRRKWPTPEQFKEEYREEWKWAAYALSHTCDGLEWIVHSKALLGTTVVCACTPWGRPPADWRPEGK